MNEQDVRKLIAEAVREERQRTARVLLRFAEERRQRIGIDPIVMAVATLANEITDPDQE